MEFFCRALVENTTCSPDYVARHGLSLYIEAHGRKILFDLGPDQSFLKNAGKMGIDIGAVDTVIISHGHFDHGGGLGTFLKNNDKARIYVREGAFEKHFSRIAALPVPIGIDRSLMDNPRIITTSEICLIDEGLSLFSGVTGRRLFSSANGNLLERTKKGLVCDSFAHEQNLVIQTSSGDIMITGCSHNGIVNIIDKYKEIYGSGRHLSHVIGGFHLCSKGSGHYESPELVRSLAETLSETGIVFHTCHCTGPVAYENMKSIMGDSLSYLRTGDSISL